MRWKKNFIHSKNNSIGPSLEKVKVEIQKAYQAKKVHIFHTMVKNYPNSNFSLQFKYSMISISQFFWTYHIHEFRGKLPVERGTHIDCDPSFKPKADDYNV